MWKVWVVAGTAGIFVACNVSTSGTKSDETPLATPSAGEVTAPAAASAPAPAPVLSTLISARVDGERCVLTYALADVGDVPASSAKWTLSSNPFSASATAAHKQDNLAAALPLQFRFPMTSAERVTRVALVMSRAAAGDNDVHDGLTSQAAGVRFAFDAAPLVASSRDGASRWPKDGAHSIRYSLDRLALQAAGGVMRIAASVECRIESDSTATLAQPRLEVTLEGRADCSNK